VFQNEDAPGGFEEGPSEQTLGKYDGKSPTLLGPGKSEVANCEIAFDGSRMGKILPAAGKSPHNKIPSEVPREGVFLVKTDPQQDS
jgi:hypothetical protein